MICVVSWLDSSIILGLDSFTYSGILNVVEWCADQKPHISDKTAANNTLIVSSSENMNDTTCNDPASFDIVISVHAIDAAYQKASFSSYNNQVNIVTPVD